MPLRTATNVVRTIFRHLKFGKTMEKQGDSYEIIVRTNLCDRSIMYTVRCKNVKGKNASGKNARVLKNARGGNIRGKNGMYSYTCTGCKHVIQPKR